MDFVTGASMNPDDPLRSAALDNAVGDGWQGARIGHRRRLADRSAARRMSTEVEIGEPGRPIVVGTFLVATLLMTAYEFVRVGVSPSPAQLDGMGGMSAVALNRGDWSTFVTGNLLHGSLVHVGLNAFVILLAGRWTEHLAGRAVMTAVILWTMLGAMVGAVMAAPMLVTVGASGVAFGILGCALAIDPRSRTPVGGIAWLLVIVNLIGTFATPGISVGGHIGGLLFGLVVGRLCWRRRATEEHPIGRPRTVVATLVSIPAAALLTGMLLVQSVAPHDSRHWGKEVAQWLVSR